MLGRWASPDYLVLSRDREIWSKALWVEKHHGEAGAQFIAQQLERLTDDPEGQAFWHSVRERFDELSALPIPIHGKPQTWPR